MRGGLLMPKINLKFDSEHATKSNPTNKQFWIALGYAIRPDNWRELYQEMNRTTSSKTRQSRRDSAEFHWHGILDKNDY